MSLTNAPDGETFSRSREFAIYDLLPPWLQEILANAPRDYAVEPVDRLYLDLKERGLSPDYIRYEIRSVST